MRYITTIDATRPALRGIADHSWHARALCRSLAPAEADKLFFPLPRNHQAIAQAKTLCGRCPVKRDCFNHALDNGTKEGVWGGLTETERRAWQAKIAKRLDYARVRAAFIGRDVHLSAAEREAVTRHAHVRGWAPERLAYTLQLDLDYARDLMREAAHAVEDRDRYWDLYTNAQDQDQAEDAEPAGTGEDQDGTDVEADDDGSGGAQDTPPVSSPVPGHIHTHALIAALGKAA
ncbi:WhiB family transcriptional regulator [Streptomyces albipurpureus]|uniref:Transcriptional regulator WhiB n=1 Tax=Streptomyces albipurpureus TaxID=2897419 RepID=A0ABT0UTX1_9ACTN|nr:WhiB family transcriptional regulator [Streptomyces sp. CWNU-1]MCM2392038.1 WhiB family transcriptional regulator [Streptomyces sp. CWNU-1]